MITNKALGKKIRAIRKSLGLTQNELADRLNVSFQAISNWERGATQIDIENLYNLSKILGVTCDFLLTSNNDTLYLGVDGGGTKTEFVVFNESGDVLYRLLLSSSNPNDIGIEKSKNLLVNGINECLSHFPGISYVFLGVAGFLTDTNRLQTEKHIKDQFPSLHIKSDGDCANIFGTVDGPKLSLIIGTGSCVFYRGETEIERIGGWGYLLDSAGSGYDIGREAIRAILNELENDNEKTIITKLFLKDNKVSLKQLIKEVYVGGKPYIASYAHYVFEAYEKDDAVAKRIIEQNALYIANLLRIAFRKHNTERHVIISGGIAEHYSHPFIDLIKKEVDVEFVVPKGPQIFGACRNALRMSKDISPEFDNRFLESYKKECELHE